MTRGGGSSVFSPLCRTSSIQDWTESEIPQPGARCPSPAEITNGSQKSSEKYRKAEQFQIFIFHLKTSEVVIEK